MSKREQGFTLIELMIVVAIIAIIASIAIPNLLSARLNANESAAIATLKNISSAQSQCQASGVIDTNANGQGEYGYFGELSGRIAIRDVSGGPVAAGPTISPPVLSAAFGTVANGSVSRSGYFFQMWLPNAAGVGQSEAATGGGDTAAIADASQAEVLWCCYAWPTLRGNSGNRTFFVNQSGDVLATQGTVVQYSGPTSGTTSPGYDAAFVATGDMSGPTAPANITTPGLGVDGNTWVVVQ